MTQGGKRPTKAERKEQARQQRLAEMRRRQAKARMRKFTWGIAVAVAAAGIAVWIVLAQQAGVKKVKDLNKLAAAAGCSEIQEPKDLGQGHITDPQERVTYNSTPPTSGKHAGRWDPTGVHSTPIQNEVQVHNLEHGHVLVQYKPDLDQAFIDKLEGLAATDNTRVIVAPYNDMDSRLAVTAWARISNCSNPTETAFITFARAFIDEFKGKGPEGDIPGTPA